MARLSGRRKRAAAVAASSVAAVLAIVGCSYGMPDDEGTRPEDPASFIESIRNDVRQQAWQSILSASDPVAYQDRVVREGIQEEQFIAELFGLDRDDNLIRTGEELVWEDFERIDSITVLSPTDTIPPVQVTGTAFLESGETRQIDAIISLVQGRFVLSLPSN